MIFFFLFFCLAAQRPQPHYDLLLFVFFNFFSLYQQSGPPSTSQVNQSVARIHIAIVRAYVQVICTRTIRLRIAFCFFSPFSAQGSLFLFFINAPALLGGFS